MVIVRMGMMMANEVREDAEENGEDCYSHLNAPSREGERRLPTQIPRYEKCSLRVTLYQKATDKPTLMA